MKPLYKYLILLEATISFGPLFFLLALGVITIPGAVISIYSGDLVGIVLLLIEIGGVLGFISFICVLLHVFDPEKYFITPNKLRWFILSGFISVLIFMYITGVSKSALWLMLPALVSMHVLYLGRRYVLSNR
jgi:hypothetical protein